MTKTCRVCVWIAVRLGRHIGSGTSPLIDRGGARIYAGRQPPTPNKSPREKKKTLGWTWYPIYYVHILNFKVPMYLARSLLARTQCPPLSLSRLGRSLRNHYIVASVCPSSSGAVKSYGIFFFTLFFFNPIFEEGYNAACLDVFFYFILFFLDRDRVRVPYICTHSDVYMCVTPWGCTSIICI